MTCRCDDRKEDLRVGGVRPLVGKDYTAVDFAQWAVMKVRERLSAG